MVLWVGVVSLLVGALAALAAIAMRRALAAALGRGWLVRYMVIQALVINGVLLALTLWMAQAMGFFANAAGWAFVGLYGLMFFFYSVSNIDWTAKKFHTRPGEAA